MTEEIQSIATPPDGVNYGRIAGRVLGLMLICIGLWSFLEHSAGVFPLFKAAYFVGYGGLLNVPFNHIDQRRWKWIYGLLVVSSVGFVFLMVIAVIFNYIAADARGERLGVPGFEGTLIFVALLQVPLVLFQRRPDLLD